FYHRRPSFFIVCFYWSGSPLILGGGCFIYRFFRTCRTRKPGYTKRWTHRGAAREPYKAAVSLPPAGPGEDYSSQRYQVKVFCLLFFRKVGVAEAEMAEPVFFEKFHRAHHGDLAALFGI